MRRTSVPRRNQLTVEPEHPRAGDAAARPRLGERAELGHGVRLGDRVRVCKQDELTCRLGDAAIRVRREAVGTLVVQHACAGRDGVDASGDVRDDDDLVDLGSQRRQ